MDMNPESHYVSFLSENAVSDDEERCQPRPSVRGSVSRSLREVMRSVSSSGSDGSPFWRPRNFFSSSFPSYYLRNIRLAWRKFERSTNIKIRLLCVAVLAAVCIFVVTAFLLNSSPVENTPSMLQGNVEEGLSQMSGDAQYPLSPYMWKEEHFESAFKNFERQFSHTYATPEERQHRYMIFKQNQSYINLHNSQKHSFTLAMNKFGDLTNEEFRRRFVGKKRKGPNPMKTAFELLNKEKHAYLPESVDWRTKKCVSEVKDQGMCGSCWAFSVTGAVEGAVCAKTGKLWSLSEQQLVDCSADEGNNGCEGGDMQYGFSYIKHAGGLCTEKDYPYKANQLECKADKCTPSVQITDYKAVPSKSEDALKTAIAENGPISVSIEADQMPFQFYSNGVFDDACGEDLDHGVLAVGYGSDDKTGKKYWIVKNSWGETWGDKGYIKLAMGKGNGGQCGILLDSSYPIA